MASNGAGETSEDALQVEQQLDRGATVQVRFSTRTEKPVSNVPIILPTSLKRYGLSQVINQLLGNGMIFIYSFFANVLTL
jgi:hypothetical protein